MLSSDSDELSSKFVMKYSAMFSSVFIEADLAISSKSVRSGLCSSSSSSWI